MALLIRAVVSLVSLAPIYWATQVYSCRWVSITWPMDPAGIWSCSDSASGGVTGQMAAAIVLASVLLIQTLVWLPVMRRRRSNKNRVTSSLAENLQRAVPEKDVEPASHQPMARDHSAIRAAAVKAMEIKPNTRQSAPRAVTTSPPRSLQSEMPPGEPAPESDLRKTISGLKTRVTMIEEALEADTLSPKEAMQQWAGLLKDCNDAHNSGRLPSSVFKDLNTRLIDLFTAPSTHNDGRP